MVAKSVNRRLDLGTGPKLARPVRESADKTEKASKTSKKENPDIEQISLPENRIQQSNRRILTTREATKQVAEKNIATARSLLLGLATVLGISTSTFALGTRVFSKTPDRKDSFAKASERFAKTSTAISYSIFALINSLAAWKAKDLGLVLSNVMEIPISMLSSSDCLTLNRGLSIGFGNIVTEAQKMFSKTEYKDFGESINCLARSLSKTYQGLVRDPFRTITNMRSGSGAIIFAAITAFSPFVKKITGSNFLAYNLRHWPGIIMEFGKINTINLQRGSYNYWTCGVMMFLSSAVNLIGSLMSSSAKASSEIMTWIPNVLGRRLLAAANIYRETTRKHAPKVTMAQAVKLAAREILHMNQPAVV